MQIKIPKRYYCTPIRKAKKKKTVTKPNAGEDGANWSLIHCWWESVMVQPLRKTVWQFLIKLKIYLPYNLTVPLLFTQREMKIYVHSKARKSVFLTVLFIITKNWKQPKGRSVGEWMGSCGTTEYSTEYGNPYHDYSTEYGIPYRGLLQSNERECCIETCSNMNESQIHTDKWWNQKEDENCTILLT